MQWISRVFLLLSAAASLFVTAAYGQEAQSLGDIARETRQQKRQNQGAQTKAAQSSKTPKVITNDQIPEHSEADGQGPILGGDHGSTVSPPASRGARIPAEQWKSQIQTQKKLVASLQSGIEKLNESIHFASGNCVAGCVQWNERQQAKQQEVEREEAQLADQKKRLEDMQESARHQGYGSSVYDP